MLRIDIRSLDRGPVETAGVLPPDDPALAGLELDLDGPVSVSGKLAETGDQEYFWQGHITGRVKSSCRRCLTDLVVPLETDVEVLFSANPELEDDPSAYLLTAPVTHVDLRPAVREELALAVSAYPLCREDCAGLCVRCGAELNAGPCHCGDPAEPD
jgi:uncharacterized protein